MNRNAESVPRYLRVSRTTENIVKISGGKGDPQPCSETAICIIWNSHTHLTSSGSDTSRKSFVKRAFDALIPI